MRLRCNGQIDDIGMDMYDVGSWHTTGYGIALVFGGVGGGLPPTTVECYPPP
jgi:hypothetical protein